MKLFNFKKKEKTEFKGAALPAVNVVICRLMNDKTPVEVYEFNAVQKKNDDGNFEIVNDQFGFKEELDRKKHYIIEHLQYKLGLMDLSKGEKLKRIEERIKELENNKSKIVDGKIGEVKVNPLDIEKDIEHYKVLRFDVENKGNGTYEIINSKGEREIRFLSRDGLFYPYFYRSDTDKDAVLTMFPDIALARKYFRETDKRIEERFLENQSGNFWTGAKGIIITIVIGILVLANIGSLIELNKQRNELTGNLQACEIKCTQKATDCLTAYTQLVNDGLISRNITIDDVNIVDKKPTSAIISASELLTGTR